MPDWDTVREIAGAFPDSEESTSYGQPAFKVRRKLFVWISPDRAAEGALATYVEDGEKELLIESDPGLYFSTPHYEGCPIVLMRLERASQRGASGPGRGLVAPARAEASRRRVRRRDRVAVADWKTVRNIALSFPKVEEAWLIQAPKRLARAYTAASG